MHYPDIYLSILGIKTVAFVTSPLLQLYGDTDHNLIHVTDWMPTFIRLAGGTPPADLDGVDQWDTLSRGMASSRIVSAVYQGSSLHIWALIGMHIQHNANLY